MKAIVVQEGKTVKVEEKPTPSLKANQILLKTRTGGINPTGTYGLLILYIEVLSRILICMYAADWKVSLSGYSCRAYYLEQPLTGR